MKKIILGLYILFFTLTAGYCEVPDRHLTLAIKSDKKTYPLVDCELKNDQNISHFYILKGEIKIYLDIKNVGQHLIKIKLNFSDKDQLGCGENTGYKTPTQVTMLDPHGNDIKFNNIAMSAPMVPASTQVLGPNQSYSAIIPYAQNYQTYKKNIPGKYSIKVEYNLDGLTVTSNTIEVEFSSGGRIIDDKNSENWEKSGIDGAWFRCNKI